MEEAFELTEELQRIEMVARLLMSNIHGNPELHRALRVKELQPIWQRLYYLALFGMNSVSGGELKESGEEVVPEFVREAFPDREVTVLDVGANVGEYSDLVARTIGERARIHAFEPLPANFADISKRFEHVPNITLVRSAVSNKVGKATFYTNAERSTIGSLVQRDLDYENISMRQEVEVPVTTVDDYCRVNGLEQVDLLKVDVEGADYDVLLGAKGMITAGKVAVIQFELGSAHVDSRHFFKDFFTLLIPHYRLYKILSNGLIEITGYGDGSEIFWCTNYVAVTRG